MIPAEAALFGPTRSSSVALTSTDHATVRPRVRLSVAALQARIRLWLADRSDNSLAQRAAGSAFLIRCASAVLVYVTQMLLARWMGGFEFGIYVYVWTWVLLIGGLADFGFSSTAQRFIPEYTKLGEIELLRGFLRGSRLLTVTVAAAIAGLATAALALCRNVVSPHEIVPLYLACGTLPFFVWTRMQEGIARSCDWINLALLPPYVFRSLLLIVLMGGAYWAGFASDAATAMGAAVLATALTAIAMHFLLRGKLAGRVDAGPRRYDVPKWYATAIPIFMVEGFYTLLTYTDVLVLQQFRPPDEVAVYYAAAKTLALVAFVYFSVSAATAHRFSEYHVSGDRARLTEFIAQAVRWTFWPSLAATAAILVLGRPFLELFGPQFVAGYKLMFILAIGLLARASVGPVERLLNMIGEQRACALVYASAFATNIIGCVVLIPRFGIEGAAIATAAAVIVESLLLFIVAKRRLQLHTFIWNPAGTR
jgi:O-antigen/teichoic acid export membrane protein